MTKFEYFCAKCKIRHDFGDQLQVRFFHPNGEKYDTWVSGDDVLGRLGSEAAEARLKGLRELNWRQIREIRRSLPDEVRERAERALFESLADGVEDNIGGNIIGDTLADSVRGRDQDETNSDSERERWLTLLYDDKFRFKVLELAWIQLEGSFPEIDSNMEPDDWI